MSLNKFIPKKRNVTEMQVAEGRLKRAKKEESKKEVFRIQVNAKTWIETTNPEKAKKKWDKILEAGKKDLQYSHFKTKTPLTNEQKAKLRERYKKGRQSQF